VYNDSLMDAFMQVVLGLANIDTLVPGALRSHDSSEFEDADRHNWYPLRNWLRKNQLILGAPVVSLFYKAAGHDEASEHETSEEDLDDEWNPSDVEISVDEDKDAEEEEDEEETEIDD